MPVDADDGAARTRHEVEQLAGPDAKEDHGYIEIGDALKDALGGRQREALVLGFRERARPGVKELNGARAMGDLGAKEADRDVDQPIEEPVEELGLSVHHRLDDRELTGRCPFDEVARDGKGGTGETNEGGVGRLELLDDAIDRVGDVGDVVLF